MPLVAILLGIDYFHLRGRHTREVMSVSLFQLLTLYRIADDNFLPRIEEQNVFEVVKDIYLQNNLVAEAFGVKLEFKCEDDLLTWNFDKALITNIINSILNNGLRYSKKQFRLSAYVDGEYLVLMMEDDSAGYPPDLLHFDAEDSLNLKTGSTAFSIYFAQVVTELHCHQNQKGSIRINNDSCFGGGCFAVLLPAVEY